MEIVIGLMGYVIDIFGFVWRHIMKPLFFNWRIHHLERALRDGDFRITAHKHEYLPYLTLLYTINNRSEIRITIKRVYGSVYVGDWRIGHFDVCELNVKQLATNRQQYITVSKKSIRKGDRSELEFNFYPPIDFWILGKDTCSVGNGGIEIQGGGVKAVIPLGKDNLKIEDIAQVSLDYHRILKERLTTILKEGCDDSLLLGGW